MPEQPKEFKPSNKYCLLTRDMFNEIKDHIGRIERADSLDYAKECATFLLKRLKTKFEPENAKQIEEYLTQRTDYLAGNSPKQVL